MPAAGQQYQTPVGSYVLTKHPEIHMFKYNYRTTYRTSYEHLQKKYGPYLLLYYNVWNNKINEVATGATQATLTFANEPRPYQWYEFNLEPTDSRNSVSPWNMCSVNKARTNIKRIEINKISFNGQYMEISYDFTKPDDLREMYLMYMSYFSDQQNSRRVNADYNNYSRVSEMKTMAEYFNSNGPLWIDMSRSKHVTIKPDPPEQEIRPQVTIYFRDALPVNYFFSIRGFFPASYVVTESRDSRDLNRLIKFIPSVQQRVEQ